MDETPSFDPPEYASEETLLLPSKPDVIDLEEDGPLIQPSHKGPEGIDGKNYTKFRHCGFMEESH